VIPSFIRHALAASAFSSPCRSWRAPDPCRASHRGAVVNWMFEYSMRSRAVAPRIEKIEERAFDKGDGRRPSQSILRPVVDDKPRCRLSSPSPRDRAPRSVDELSPPVDEGVALALLPAQFEIEDWADTNRSLVDVETSRSRTMIDPMRPRIFLVP